jgi:2-polyprenyl-6-hydroxyphenyl methylase/3-demethylubiquinone-9 3-methyltransferase
MPSNSQTEKNTTKNMNMDMNMDINVDPKEIAKFSASASRWWDLNGEFKLLHQLNPLRIQYIQSQCEIKHKKVLDIGCGGGILSEGLAQKGAIVTGIDFSEPAIKIAKLHLYESKLPITYEYCTAETFAEKAENFEAFDVIICMEMLEHVPDPTSVLEAASRLLKPNGWLITSTINRNPTSFLESIVAAEYLLGLIPKGTHQYEKFIKPAELASAGREVGLTPMDSKGFSYQPFKALEHQLSLTSDVSVNYFLSFVKS